MKAKKISNSRYYEASELLRNSITSNELVKTFEWYEGISKSYDELYKEEQQSKYEVLTQLIKSKDIIHRREYRILDVGCGTLELLSYLISKNLEPLYYVGLDLSYSLLTQGRKKFLLSSTVFDIVACDLMYPPLRADFKFHIITFFSVILCDYKIDSIVLYYLVSHLFRDGLILFTVVCNKEDLLSELISDIKDILNLDACNLIRHNEIICWKVGVRNEAKNHLNKSGHSCTG